VHTQLAGSGSLVSHVLQQSASVLHVVPAAPAEVPPQVLSHVPQLPPQQSVSAPQAAPFAASDAPPQVLSQVPQLPLQQSPSTLHPLPSAVQLPASPVLDATQVTDPVSHVRPSQHPRDEQSSPALAHAPPDRHVCEVESQLSPPQQPCPLEQSPPCCTQPTPASSLTFPRTTHWIVALSQDRPSQQPS
jgi:hypothetical protein